MEQNTSPGPVTIDLSQLRDGESKIGNKGFGRLIITPG